MTSTGIFGGSFNPIHTGHVALARQIRSLYGLDEVWFMVSPLNPFKEQASDLLADDLRLDLVRRALCGEDGLVASDYEFSMPRPSYTYMTLRRLATDYPDHQFTLIIGSDNWLSFDRWAHADEIASNHDIIIYPRKGFPVDEASLPHSVHLAPTALLPVSSTAIRDMASKGQSIAGLVPAAIEAEVMRLYSSTE